MKKTILFLLTLLGLLSFNSCNKDSFGVSNKNFNTEISPLSNLEFTFSENVVADSLVGVWQDVEYIKIEPKVQGKFKWLSNNTLCFSPSMGFAPSTDYTAELTSVITEKSKLKKKLDSKDVKHSFHTAYLTLLNVDYYWAKTDDVVEVKTALNFNYVVKPADVAKNLEIYIDGKKINFLLKSSLNSEVVEVSIPEATNSFEQKPVKLVLKSGLGCLNSSYKTAEDIILESNIPAKGAFSITEITAEVINENHTFNIHTNQSIDKGQDLAGLIKIFDASNNEVQSISFDVYDFGVFVKGTFEESENYEIKVSADLKGVFGGTLGKEVDMYLSFIAQEPKLSFAAKSGIYLTSKGERNLGVKAINVKEFEVKIYKIYENNIIHFLNNSNAIESSNYYEYGGYEEEGYYYDEYRTSNNFYGNYDDYGKLVSSTVVNTMSLPKNGKQFLLNLNLNDTEENKGIYVVKIISQEKYYLNDTKILAFSDLGLIVKEDKEDVYVFVNGIQSASAESGVKVELVTRNNQTVATAESDGDGTAVFKGIKSKLDSELKMVLAKKGNDFTYLHFNQTKVDLSKFDMGGEVSTLSGYQLFVYGDRDLYRPGEKIYVNTVLRDDNYGTVANFPLEIVLRTPNGNEMTRVKGVVNSQGAFATAFTVPVAGVTGTYSLEVYSANKVLLNSKNISVEEFMPDRISLNTSLDKEEVAPNQSVTLSATASNLFGTPAALRNYEVSLTVSKKYLYFKNFSDYNFSVSGDLSKEIKTDLRQGKTSANGTLDEVFEIPGELRNSGVYTAKTFTTVFDENGRPVNRVNTFDIITQNEFFGIGAFDYYADIRQPISVPLVAVDKKGAPRQTSARVQVIKYNWRTVLQKTEYGEYRYQSQRQEQVIDERTITVVNNSSYKFTVGQSGEYAVRVRKADSKCYVESNFYAYGYGYTSGSDFEVNQDGEVSIVADKETYDLGEEATILFKTPFVGKLLVTIERNKVFEHRIIDTDAKSATMKLEMKEEYLPNVYISATLLRPISSNTNLPLTVAHGYLPIKVNKSAAKIPVTIEAVELSRSKTKQTIKVKTNGKKDVQVTIAVVDEGILQIKNYKTPEPYEFFFRPRKLEVNSYDLYPRLFPELKMQKASFGADGYNLGKRLNPLGNKRVNLVSFWSGHLTTNGNGEASYTIDIPQFSGDLRIMAVAYQDKSFGSADKHMKVADPIVVSSGLPRFLSPNDKVVVPVTLSNTTNKATQATVSISTGNILAVDGGSSQQVTIEPKMEKRVFFKVLAKPNIGNDEVTVTVKALGESFVEKTSISIRPTTPLEKKSYVGSVLSGKLSTVDGEIEGMIPSTVSGKLIIGKSPLIQFSNNLNDLIQYPYGCVEQTVSTAFPQLYFSDICKAIGYRKGSPNNPNYNVQQAIEKLNTMQLSSGGLSYWQGGDYLSWYGSVYAAHFMLEAKTAGFKVDQNVLERLVLYLSAQVKSKPTETYYYYLDDTYTKMQTKTIISKELVYSLYVLALAQRQDLPTMNYLKANQDLLSLDCKYLLASTYKMVGDNSSYQQILPSTFASEVSQRVSNASFYSYIRDEAMALNALLVADAQNKQIPVLANHLSIQIKKYNWLSTQEMAFSMLALGKFARRNNDRQSSAKVTINGKNVLNYDGSKPNEVYEFKGGNDVAITNSGKGDIYYYVEYEGINATKQIEERDNYIRIRRTYFDRSGNQISNGQFKQNDLVVVKLALDNIEGTSIDNVVVTDLLPAGFEIENARLTESEDMDWIKDRSSYDYMDVRDDRINFFTTAYGTKNFYYMVRAVSPGTFVQGPASADAMYNGEYQSYNGAGQINISEK